MLPYGRDLRERVGQKQQKGQKSPREEPRWRSASPIQHSYPGEPCHATALAELWEIRGNNCKQTKDCIFTAGWVNGKGAEYMACRCKYSLIFHLFLHIRSSALPATTTPFISENRISREIPNKLLLGFHFPQLESPRE